jgi:peptidyl-prolyl cis-trans isomerase C
MMTVNPILLCCLRSARIAAVVALPTVCSAAAYAAEIAAPQDSHTADSGNPADSSANGSDPVMADVDGHSIRLSEVGDAIGALPDAGAGNSFETLYPIVVGQLVRRIELALRARSDGLDHDPTVRRHMDEADDRVLEDAYLREKGMKNITEGALLARYATEIARKPGPQQVHAEAILVPTEAAAEDIIAKLAKGADFAALARQVSQDSSSLKGGDLGFVSLDQLSPELGAVLFELRPGEVTPYPLHTAVGWFVLKDEARRAGPTPSFAEARDGLTRQMLRQQVPTLTRDALSTAVVRLYDIDGRELTGGAPDGVVGTDPAH